MVDRGPVVSAEELETLDSAEVLEGYQDGLAGDDEPGDNRSKAYWHGWRNGRADRTGKPDASQIALVRDLKAKGRR